MKKYLETFQKYFYSNFPYFIQVPIKLIISSLVIRIFEAISIKYFSTSTDSVIKYSVQGFFYDIPLVLKWAVYYLPFFLILFYFSKKAARIVTNSILLVFIVSQFILIEYFRTMLIPLDEVVYSYTAKELKMIVDMSATTNYGALISGILSALGVIVLLYFISKKFTFLRSKISINIVAISMVISLLIASKVQVKKNAFKDNLYYYETLNKLDFFVKSSFDFFQKSKEFKNSDYEHYIKEYQKEFPNREFSSIKFPLLYKNNYADVLGNYFNIKDQKPNIVFIIVESLGKSITSPTASYMSLTPFLDSLSEHSLVWDNFLSNAERTFAVLPNIFGSLPFGERGFADILPAMPQHESLIKILTKNGYYSSFYYGGWTYFNKMSVFLKRNNTSFILENFDSTYVRMKPNESGFSWGYHDGDVFKHSFDYVDTIKKPRLDIYLTLSTHSPWFIPKPEKYQKAFLSYIEKKHLDKNSEKYRILQKDMSMALCFFYSDNCIREYFNRIKKTKGFENTIFIITGDHRQEVFPTKSAIDLYHVPFIIYSPLLKKTHRFKSVSTHMNIAPTILNFMHKNYNLPVPQYVPWMGDLIDTCSTFRNIHTLPFIRNNRKIVNLIDKEYYLDDKEAYKIKDGMYLESIENDKIAKMLITKLTNFKHVNNYVKNNKICIICD